MKSPLRYLFRCTVLAIIAAHPLRASETADARPFSSNLSPEERAAIGLDHMSKEQVAALEAAVAHYLEGRTKAAATSARQETRAELTSEIQQREKKLAQERTKLAEAQAALTKREEEAKPSFLERATVLLRPGTKIEYTRLESVLTDPFKGWTPGTLFHLENGQTWRVVEGDYWTPREDPGKKVTIVPGALGSFFIEIEGVHPTPKVTLVDSP